MSATCPKCEAALKSIKVDAVPLKDGTGTWKGATYACPHCGTCLGASIDPLAWMTEIVKKLKGR